MLASCTLLLWEGVKGVSFSLDSYIASKCEIVITGAPKMGDSLTLRYLFQSGPLPMPAAALWLGTAEIFLN